MSDDEVEVLDIEDEADAYAAGMTLGHFIADLLASDDVGDESS